MADDGSGKWVAIGLLVGLGLGFIAMWAVIQIKGREDLGVQYQYDAAGRLTQIIRRELPK